MEAEVRRMMDAMRHRGPDGEGLAGVDGAVIGHRRLAIIDLTSGAQPMSDPRGYKISFNGEIYNFRDLRRNLERIGEHFFTTSDTEVALKAFVRWGPSFLERLNGMFTLAILDERERTLFLARDRLGIKPLYYAHSDNVLAFASEIPALLSCSFVPRDLDLRFFPFYMAHGYFPSSQTPYAKVAALRPGHFLQLDACSRSTVQSYWDIEQKYHAGGGSHRVTQGEEECIRDLVRSAVEMQMVADVPIGAFLSGGIDSAIVTSLLASASNAPPNTFTVCFPTEPIHDESAAAREVAIRYRTRHHTLDIVPEDMVQLWERLLPRFGQPFADTSIFPTYLISKFAREHVKVVLSGDGGDEQFGGYDVYRRYLQLRRLRSALPSTPTRALGEMLSAHPVTARRAPRLACALERYGPLFDAPDGYLYADLIRIQDPRLVAGERLAQHLESPDVQASRWRDEALHLDGVMLHDLKQYMVDDVLRKVDIMSMASSLEVRVPLLDHRIVEATCALSWRDKVSTSQTKRLLRKIYANVIPERILLGKKRGFSVPIDGWLRGPLRSAVHDVLLSPSSRQRGVIDTSAVARMLEEHDRGLRQNGGRLWTLFVLELWLSRQPSSSNALP